MNKVLSFKSTNNGGEVTMHAKVDSSTIVFVYWSNIVNNNGAMVITFAGGRRYRYENVEANTFSTLISADSVGKKFNEIVRGKYDYKLDAVV